MEIGGYKKEYLNILHDNFPFLDYISKYTDLNRENNLWTGVCPLCEYSQIKLKENSWYCKNCTQMPDGAEPIFYSPESFLSKFHRLDIFDAICFMEGWVRTHTEVVFPKERYVYIETDHAFDEELAEVA